MDWQTQLITVYLTVCDLYRRGLWVHGQRFAPYADLRFTDEEAITLYLCGILDGKCQIKTLYEHARRYWRDWFPHLPSYGGFVQRLNRLADVFPALLERWSPAGAPATPIGVADSFTVVLAQQARRYTAKVAKDLAASGYCPTKKLYYHGVKIHVIGDERPGTLPRPRYIALTAANLNDGPVLEQIAPSLGYRNLFADKAYEYLSRQTSLPFTVFTPVRKTPGQAHLDAADRLYSTAVSRVRQPIEALFNWIQAKTGIEAASKVRSSRGLLVHVFGRLAAAMFLLNQWPDSP
jgi:hypothetical protein